MDLILSIIEEFIFLIRDLLLEIAAELSPSVTNNSNSADSITISLCIVNLLHPFLLYTFSININHFLVL